MPNLVVLEIGHGVASAVAGMLLSDLGARVIKVEPSVPVTERACPADIVWNRGKESWVCDPAEASAEAMAHRLLASSDVMITLSPRSSDNLASLFRRIAPGNQRLITCSIGGFGSRGDLADRPCSDALIAAYMGRCADQVGWEPGPSHIVHLVPSIAAGLLSVQGVLAAVMVRERTGRGQDLETSLLAAALAAAELVDGPDVPAARPLSPNPRGVAPFYSLFECADKRWLQLGCLHAGFVKNAIAALELAGEIEEITADPGFGDGVTIASQEASKRLYEVVERAIMRRPLTEWLARLDAADVPASPVEPSEDYLDDPQGRENGIAEVSDPRVGPVVQVAGFVRLGGLPAQPRSAPEVGEHQDLPAPQPGSTEGTVAGSKVFATSGPLEGVVVLELANIIAGPLVGRCLAELGADVIKLESLEGDVFRQQRAPEFLALNSGKRSVAVDLKHPIGKELGRELAERADVVVNNMRPGVAERLGLGYNDLRGVNPGLVYCQVTAFGVRGPYAARPGGDPLAGAFTGMQWAQGRCDFGGRPEYVRGAPIDNVAGLLATVGILAALVARDGSRRGPNGRDQPARCGCSPQCQHPHEVRGQATAGRRSEVPGWIPQPAWDS